MKYIISLALVLTSLIYLHGQCYPDRHNTTWFHGWTSCEISANPNTNRSNSHWILYDFGHVYKLEDLHIWNINDPFTLENGLKEVIIDYSLNGTDWVEFGNASFEKGTGKSIYEGQNALNFGGIKTRYLLITGIKNYGGECFGFSELRIGVSPITATELVNFDMNCTEKDGYTELNWTLTNESKTVSFEVEKSFDGNNWKTINTTGNIAVKEGVNIYKYNAKSNDDAYYRVKVSEKDGSYAYSNSHFCSKSSLIIKAFPNPFINDFKIELLAQNNEPIIYSLTDIYGRTIREGILNTNSTINQLEFNNLNLESGNYFVLVRQGHKTGQLKLVKINID